MLKHEITLDRRQIRSRCASTMLGSLANCNWSTQAVSEWTSHISSEAEFLHLFKASSKLLLPLLRSMTLKNALFRFYKLEFNVRIYELLLLIYMKFYTFSQVIVAGSAWDLMTRRDKSLCTSFEPDSTNMSCNEKYKNKCWMGKASPRGDLTAKKIACFMAFPYNYAWLEFIDFS